MNETTTGVNKEADQVADQASAQASALEMSPEEHEAEKLYYLSQAVVQSMLREGGILKEIYAQIDTKLLQKYRPISGTLLAGFSLT